MPTPTEITAKYSMQKVHEHLGAICTVNILVYIFLEILIQMFSVFLKCLYFHVSGAMNQSSTKLWMQIG